MDHFFASILERARSYKRGLPYKFMPRLAALAAWGATYEAARQLRKSGPLDCLLDSNVLAHAVTHEEAWIDTGVVMWGGKIPISTGYMARIPVHSVDNKSQSYRDICRLTGLSYLARKGLLRFVTSSELMAEQNRQPPARFRSTSISGMSLFDGLNIPSLDGWNMDWLSDRTVEELASLQRDRLDQTREELFGRLMTIFGHATHSQDAWHISTAEKHNCAFFITMDYKLVRLIKTHRKKIEELQLTTRIVTPLELGQLIKIRPLAPYLFSYDNASFPVRSDLCMPDEKRNSTTRKKKA